MANALYDLTIAEIGRRLRNRSLSSVEITREHATDFRQRRPHVKKFEAQRMVTVEH